MTEGPKRSDSGAQASKRRERLERLYEEARQAGLADRYRIEFPDVEGARMPVSIDGGRRPRWAHSGRELFYVDDNRALVAARVDTRSGFRVEEREVLFTVPPEYTNPGNGDFYDVAPDDRRFLMVRDLRRDSARATFTLTLVQNVFEVLREEVGNQRHTDGNRRGGPRRDPP